MKRTISLVLALAACPALSQPQPAPAPTCAAPAPLPPELAGWTAMTPLAAGMRGADAPALTIGQGARVTLMAPSHLSFAPAPEKPGAADSRGGILSFTVPQAGRYRVALGAGAWIDVVQGGKAATSVAHDHGPDCSGVRKMVDFDLQPGRHILQIAGNTDPTIGVMVVRVGS